MVVSLLNEEDFFGERGIGRVDYSSIKGLSTDLETEVVSIDIYQLSLKGKKIILKTDYSEREGAHIIISHLCESREIQSHQISIFFHRCVRNKYDSVLDYHCLAETAILQRS
jgi:hypothetical protein